MYTTSHEPIPTPRAALAIAQALTERRERARRERASYHLTRRADGSYYVVTGDLKRRYATSQTACTCSDFQHRGAELGACKHVYMVRTEEEIREERQARIAQGRKHIDNDFPTDEYDRKPVPVAPRPLVHPLESGLVEIEQWQRPEALFAD